jgi:hypothetical protein
MKYSSVDNIIRTAIANKNVIEFTYRGRQRIAEPHVYGIHNDRRQLLVYQTGGDSASGALPDWRRMNVDEIFSIRITPQTFDGNRSLASGKHSSFDNILAVASIRDEIAE